MHSAAFWCVVKIIISISHDFEIQMTSYKDQTLEMKSYLDKSDSQTHYNAQENIIIMTNVTLLALKKI